MDKITKQAKIVAKKTAKAASVPIKATNGYKTVVSVVMFLLMAVLGDKLPLLADNREVIEEILMYAMGSGVLHKFARWLIRNFKSIKCWSIDSFKKIINKLKK